MASSRPLPLIMVACRLDGVSSLEENGNPFWSSIAVSKQSWIVRTEITKNKYTELHGGIPVTGQLDSNGPVWILVIGMQSNVRKRERKKPHPPCVVCKGSGREDCHQCQGRGRTNWVNLTMLPKGEWPRWCKTCGGSGLGYCNRCLGTGEYRDVMGFHFMKINSNSTPRKEGDKATQ